MSGSEYVCTSAMYGLPSFNVSDRKNVESTFAPHRGWFDSSFIISIDAIILFLYLCICTETLV